MYNVVSLRVVPLLKSLVRLEGNYTHQIIRIMIPPNNQQQILEHEVFNRLTKLTTHRQSLERLRKINTSMNIKQDTNKVIQELKRTQSNDEKWKLLIKWLENFSKTI